MWEPPMTRVTDGPYDSDAWARFIRAKRTAADKTITAYAVMLRVSPSYLGQLEQGVRPTPARLKRMVQTAGENPAEWFAAAGYTESMIPPGQSTVVVSDQPLPSLQELVGARVPIAGTIEADGRIVMDQPANAGAIRYLDCTVLQAAAASYVVRAVGDTAFPIIVCGDVVGVRELTTARPGDLVVVEGADDKWLLRYTGREQARPKLAFVNPSYPAPPDGLAIVGRAVWIVREADAIRRFGR